jgi:hypothetical protein
MKQILNNDKVKLIIYSIVLFLVIDIISGVFIFELFKNSKSGIVLKEKMIFFESDSDLLILGSSRAAFQYVPEVFEKNLSMSSYNAGREGTGIFFEYAVLIATLERYTPRAIILDVDFRDVYDRGGDFGADVFTQLSPYYGLVNNEFDQYISRKPYDRFFYQSSLIKYNNKILNIFTANISNNDKTVKGFKPLVGNWDGVIKPMDEEFNYSEELVNTIERFLRKTKENNIDLTLVISPTHKVIPDDFIAIIDSIASRNGIRLLNYMNHEELNKVEYFYDLEHLNYEGALKFSEILSENLQRKLN